MKIGDWIETGDLNPLFRFCQVTGFDDYGDLSDPEVGSVPVVYAQSPYYAGIRGNTYYFRSCVKRVKNKKQMEQKALLARLECES